MTFPERSATRPLWLVTLADLGLLLVGFFVLLQADGGSRAALARGLRAGFGAAAEPRPAAPMPVAVAAMLDFAPGSAALPRSPEALIGWAREAARDPRVVITVTGEADGSAADVDRSTGSPALLAADRARALGAVLAQARVVAPDRLLLAIDPHRRRATIVTLGFAGPRP